MISFTFKNNSGLQYNSLDDFGIYLTQRPTLPRAERNFRFTEIDGRNGSLTEDLETYNDNEIKLSCITLNTDIENDLLDGLNNWLNGEGGILTFSFLFNKYFVVKKVSNFEIKESSGILGEFEVTFICEPFKYLNNGQTTITVTTTPTTINNMGTYKSEPYLKVYGSGNITLTINNKNIILSNVVDYVEIDSNMMNCFKGTQSTNNQMTGEFPQFMVGNNTISWVGSVKKLEITPRWRCL